jgi:uncharacterized protein (DUF2126 family)
VHAPLTFDMVDTWMKRSLGSCQYHPANPGGLSYESFRVNSFEAESRRLTRFTDTGHTPGVKSHFHFGTFRCRVRWERPSHWS